MAKKLYGTDPDQVPTNADLGTIAYQDNGNVNVGTINTTGDVGINTTSRMTDLTIAHNAHGLGLGYEGATLPALAGLYTSSSTNYGQAYGSLIVKSRTDYAGYSIIFRTQSGEAARFNSAGNLAFPSGKGIDFSATANAGTSELLDDYEEGTFNPDYHGTGTYGTTTFTSRRGSYTKIGNQVTVQIHMAVTATTATGDAVITGLPYANNGTHNAVGTVMAENYGFSSSTGWVTCYLVTGSANDLRLYLTSDNASWNRQDVDGSFGMYITLTYTAA
tara:strand:+ start:1229 stop:2053 length:825 start_codon:yes stop_codon:yes gene_type:complete